MAVAAALHVTNGDCTVETLRATGLGGEVIAWRDTLTEGPVPALLPAALRARRARFLADCGWDDAAVLEAELEQRDATLTRALAEGRHVVLWFEHDLYDQLQLLQILALAAVTPHDPSRPG